MRTKPVTDVITAHTGVTLAEMRAKGRQPEHVIHARNILIYVLVEAFDIEFVEVADFVKRDRSTCLRAWRKMLELKQQPIYNRLLVMICGKCRNAYRKQVVKSLKNCA